MLSAHQVPNPSWLLGQDYCYKSVASRVFLYNNNNNNDDDDDNNNNNNPSIPGHKM